MPPVPLLTDLGWDEGWAAALAETADPTLAPGRVSRVDRGVSTVLTAIGAVRVASGRGVDIAVGDWVTVGPGAAADDPPRVAGVLPRRCVFRRATPGADGGTQVVAANIDTVLVVDALDGNLSLRHLERYLALAWESGATPVVVVTKADLDTAEAVADAVAAVESVALEVAVHVVSAATGVGLHLLSPYLGHGRTVALLGLSGAGKSTLVNLLAGAEVLATGAVRSDGKGRHTTTHRELVLLPSGGLLVDTPGMRALSVGGAGQGIRQAFAEVEALAETCARSDCTHHAQPGCAVAAAVAAGRLAPGRMESWLRLRGEPDPTDHQAARDSLDARRRAKALAKTARRRGPAG